MNGTRLVILSALLCAACATTSEADDDAKLADAAPDCAADAAACTQLALERAWADDHEGALGLFEEACAKKDAEACTYVGLMYRDGRGTEADPESAIGFFETGCEGGHMPGCTNLGAAYARGDVVDQDDARAVELFLRACEGADASACFNIGQRLKVGRGTPADPARGHEFLEAACALGHREACEQMAAVEALHGK
jgi:TPR repeat protein